MNIRKTSWGLLLLFITLTSISVRAQTQAQTDREACGEYQKVDAELNRVYQQVVGGYKSDGLFIMKLRGAQRAWLGYRDRQLEALYPAREPQRAYGSVHRMCRCQALTELTIQRLEELRRWDMGVEEGDVCSGSIRIRGYTGGTRRRAKPKHGLKRSRNSTGLLSSKALAVADAAP